MQVPTPRLALSLVCSAALLVSTVALAAPMRHTTSKTAKANKVKAPAPAGEPYANRPEVMAQIDDIAQRRSLDPAWVRQVLADARHVPQIAKLVAPAPRGTAKNWRVYRARFIEPIRIQAGVKFWLANRATLQRAEQEYGVPADIIVGIIGVESIYGQQTGNFRVIDALATLSFDFPTSHPRAAERTALFKAELEQFLTLHQRAGTDPSSTRGSFAGAIGMPQFLPSSWIKYAVDFDGDGKIDLQNSAADVIGSVANYFKAFNWQRAMPTHFPMQLDASHPQRDALVAPDILPTFSVASLQSMGVSLDEAAAQYPGKLAVVELQNGDPSDARNLPTYVLGTDNFYAVTRYNWSSYYALTVIELGREVSAACKACATIH